MDSLSREVDVVDSDPGAVRPGDSCGSRAVADAAALLPCRPTASPLGSTHGSELGEGAVVCSRPLLPEIRLPTWLSGQVLLLTSRFTS